MYCFVYLRYLGLYLDSEWKLSLHTWLVVATCAVLPLGSPSLTLLFTSVICRHLSYLGQKQLVRINLCLHWVQRRMHEILCILVLSRMQLYYFLFTMVWLVEIISYSRISRIYKMWFIRLPLLSCSCFLPAFGHSVGGSIKKTPTYGIKQLFGILYSLANPASSNHEHLIVPILTLVLFVPPNPLITLGQ